MTVDELFVSPTEMETTMNYPVCYFCGVAFESLPFWGCCSRCYGKSESIRAAVDSVYPTTNAFAKAKQDAMNAEVR